MTDFSCVDNCRLRPAELVGQTRKSPSPGARLPTSDLTRAAQLKRDCYGISLSAPLGAAAKAMRARAGRDLAPVRSMIAARWFSTVR